MHWLIAILGIGLTAYCLKVIHDYLMGKGPDSGLLNLAAMFGEAVGIGMIGYGAGLIS
jgi:hypothetical protein